MTKKKKIDFSDVDIDVSPERLRILKNKIRDLSDKEIDSLIEQMRDIVTSNNIRKSLINNIELLLKIAAIAAVVVWGAKYYDKRNINVF